MSKFDDNSKILAEQFSTLQWKTKYSVYTTYLSCFLYRIFELQVYAAFYTEFSNFRFTLPYVSFLSRTKTDNIFYPVNPTNTGGDQSTLSFTVSFFFFSRTLFHDDEMTTNSNFMSFISRSHECCSLILVCWNLNLVILLIPSKISASRTLLITLL